MLLLFIKIMVVLVIYSFIQNSQVPKAGSYCGEASSCFRSFKIVCVCWWPCARGVLSPESFCFDWISWTKSKLMWFSLKQVKQNPSTVCLFYHHLFCRSDFGKWTKAILKGKIHDFESLTVVTFPAHLKIFIC